MVRTISEFKAISSTDRPTDEVPKVSNMRTPWVDQFQIIDRSCEVILEYLVDPSVGVYTQQDFFKLEDTPTSRQSFTQRLVSLLLSLEIKDVDLYDHILALLSGNSIAIPFSVEQIEKVDGEVNQVKIDKAKTNFVSSLRKKIKDMSLISSEIIDFRSARIQAYGRFSFLGGREKQEVLLIFTRYLDLYYKEVMLENGRWSRYLNHEIVDILNQEFRDTARVTDVFKNIDKQNYPPLTEISLKEIVSDVYHRHVISSLHSIHYKTKQFPDPQFRAAAISRSRQNVVEA